MKKQVSKNKGTRELLTSLESDDFRKLKTLIEALTHSGSQTLDETIFKDVKKICKSSQENIPHAYNLVLTQLKKKNSQIRLAAFQICKELFKRSALYRDNVLKDLNLVFELTAEIDSSKKLPPPKSYAESLKSLAISTLKEWVDEFGETHKKLKVAYGYFEKCKKVDFTTLQVGTSSEQVVENEYQRHIQEVNKEKIKKIMEEYNGNESEIDMTVTSLQNCLSLLLPPAEDFFIPEANFSDSKIQDSKSTNKTKSGGESSEEEEEDVGFLINRGNLREFGVPLDYNLSLQINIGETFKVEKTEENSSIIENAKDCVRLIQNRFLPMVKKWIKIYCKCSDRPTSEMKKIIDLKEKLENVLKKHNSIVINDVVGEVHDSDSSDDDFEEVKKEGYEESVDFSDFDLPCLSSNSTSKPEMKKTESVSKEKTEEPFLNEPGPSGVSTSTSSTSEEMDRKKKLLSIAPKLPYDIDLYHWEDENLSAPTLISTKIDVDKFWGSAGSDDIHEIPNPEGVAALRTRVIEFSGKFEPVKWACRAPLPNGKLCPRRDRYKCPFHGKIVARNAVGEVENPDDLKDIQVAAETSSSGLDFQDAEFLNDLQAATGVNLKIPDKKGKKRKLKINNQTHKKMKTSNAALRILENKKLPGLVDVVKKQNNAYTRLSKKIFNKSSMRRVSAVLNKLDRNKYRDKFGDQFNYS